MDPALLDNLREHHVSTATLYSVDHQLEIDNGKFTVIAKKEILEKLIFLRTTVAVQLI